MLRYACLHVGHISSSYSYVYYMKKQYKVTDESKPYCTCIIQEPEQIDNGPWYCVKCEKPMDWEVDMDLEYEKLKERDNEA